ncbi:hypothetical protein CDD83_3846 [Cordyceps sp. RAO-2017]|nr:hypothetical protein CDD83_3846 [Cordyceps sp. RAO-2017]
MASFDDDDDPLVSRGGGAGCGDDGTPGLEEAMEDDMPDYKLFAAMFEKRGVSSKTIRKGEKDFESHGTRSQDAALENSRSALEEVLRYTRVHRADAWIRGWYFPDRWGPRSADGDGDDSDGRDPWLGHRVVVVEHEKGGWMKDIGRTATGSDKDRPGIGRLWLLPEEALHLVERGTLDLWWPDLPLSELLPRGAPPSREGFGPDDYDVGLTLSLEAAYSLLVGYDADRGKTTLPKYQVYAHLKRAGYHVLRAPPPAAADSHPSPPPPPPAPAPAPTALWQWFSSLLGWGRGAEPKPLGPLVSPGIYRAYGPIYRQLALLPRHRPAEQQQQAPPQEPFRVCYHVWKPGGAPFSKKSPPAPDFRVAVADTRGSGLPTLEQLDALLASTPPDPPGEAMQGPGRLYQRLRHGHRNVVVAVVDSGLVNFMRFGEAAFGEERLFERFDARGGGRGRGGKRGGGRGRGRGRGRGGRGRGGPRGG